MRIGRVVYWERDVLAAWRRSVNNADRPDSDVWGKLPPNVCWVTARIEDVDVPKIHVIGSSDWKDIFGTYRLVDIASQAFHGTDDKHTHRSRILGIENAYATGKHFEPIAMVASSGEGPFVVIQGNHRAVAIQRLGLLVGQTVFVGLHEEISASFGWFRQAVEN